MTFWTTQHVLFVVHVFAVTSHPTAVQIAYRLFVRLPKITVAYNSMYAIYPVNEFGQLNLLGKMSVGMIPSDCTSVRFSCDSVPVSTA